jgi:hypothetical protein
MTLRQAAIVALLVAASWMPTAHATADGPDFYAVTDVAADDVLMTGKQREASRKHYWCKVRYQGVDGWVAGRFLREDSGAPATVTTESTPANFGMICRETAAWQVGVSDDGDIRQEDTSIREILPLTIDVKLQGGTDLVAGP